MPRIIDNVQLTLEEVLEEAFVAARNADFCVGYFHVRGWARVAPLVEQLRGRGKARVLVGMHRPEEEQMCDLHSALRKDQRLDGPTVARLAQATARSFRTQIAFGVPDAQSREALTMLAAQLSDGLLQVRAYLRYPLHAKLCIVEREDAVTPLVAFVGSSNLTLAGISRQGELNVEVVDQDAARKLLDWFNERWDDQFTVDITKDLLEAINTSWIRQAAPYHVFLKMAYHLSGDARVEPGGPKLPAKLEAELLDFQKAAVWVCVRKIRRMGGALLGDVVGLGKTVMAVAVARVLEAAEEGSTLVICPPNLEEMWQQHIERYGVRGRTLSIGAVINTLPSLQRYATVIIDESHNLRNPEGKRHRVIRDYIRRNSPYVLLVTATPYNKHYADLSGQLRLFVDDREDLGMRPEQHLAWRRSQGLSEADLLAQLQAPLTCLRAFEQSEFAEDWRNLMRLFTVRRTRAYIQQHYASYDQQKNRYYVTRGQERYYFPKRQPRTEVFGAQAGTPDPQYDQLYSEQVVDTIADLHLPRYGLAGYLIPSQAARAKGDDKRVIENLNRAGRRLLGFCRTALFKRLESSGYSFLLSLQRHVLRNLVTWHAYTHGLPIPIGPQDPATLDEAITDTDAWGEADAGENLPSEDQYCAAPMSLRKCKQLAAEVYDYFREGALSRFSWLDPKYFLADLAEHLLADARALLGIIQSVAEWRPDEDAKLRSLMDLLVRRHPQEKVLVFTQFADTAVYLGTELKRRGIKDLEVVTAAHPDPTCVARRFSPEANGGLREGEKELRVVIATDTLAEGQNLQDAYIVVNYDLPWAIIRLIQRAGRLDRIGQKHDTIFVYSFLPAEGVEKVIRLRERLFRRLRENQEVIGTDETFFGEQEQDTSRLKDLYTEKAAILEEPQDQDVDLASVAYGHWKSASEADRKAALELPDNVMAARFCDDSAHQPPGAITYLRFPDGSDALVRVDARGNVSSQSVVTVFQEAICAPDTPSAPLAENHDQLVRAAIEAAYRGQDYLTGALGGPRSVRYQVYQRLKQIQVNPSLDPPIAADRLAALIETIHRYPLQDTAAKTLATQLHTAIGDADLVSLLWQMHESGSLVVATERPGEPPEPVVICSLGLRRKGESDA